MWGFWSRCSRVRHPCAVCKGAGFLMIEFVMMQGGAHETAKPCNARHAPALLQIRHLPAVRQHDLHEAQKVRPVLGSMTTGNDHVADLDRVLVPTTYPG